MNCSALAVYRGHLTSLDFFPSRCIEYDLRVNDANEYGVFLERKELHPPQPYLIDFHGKVPMP